MEMKNEPEQPTLAAITARVWEPAVTVEVSHAQEPADDRE